MPLCLKFKPPSVVSSCLFSGTTQIKSGLLFKAIFNISFVAAISRLRGIFNFDFILSFLKKKKVTGKIIGGYYPYNYEIDILQILKKFEKKKFIITLPKIKKNSQMNFFEWSTNDPLVINKFGIPEPISGMVKYPDVLLVPIVAFDKKFNRIGYGGGFYDRYIKRVRKRKKILTIGFAYSFQKVKKIPTNSHDIGLDFIITNE